MRRFFFFLLFISLSLVSVYSQNTDVSEEAPVNVNKKFYQIGVGSAYSFYFWDIEKVIDLMDKGSLTRAPFSINLLFGRTMSKTTAWTISLTAGIDTFSASSDSFTINTMLLAGGFQYMPYQQKGLILGIDAGVLLLIPDTNLSYKGAVEVGSSVALDIGYMFNSIKFSKAGIIPGLGIKLIHSEMFRGTINQICGYINFRI